MQKGKVIETGKLAGLGISTVERIVRQSKLAKATMGATDVPTKRSNILVTKMFLPSNCRGGLDGNVHADFCPNMSSCGKRLDSSKIESTDYFQETARIGPAVFDISAHAETLPEKKRGDAYMSALPQDLKNKVLFLLPKVDAVKFAKAYAEVIR